MSDTSPTSLPTGGLPPMALVSIAAKLRTSEVASAVTMTELALHVPEPEPISDVTKLPPNDTSSCCGPERVGLHIPN